MRRDEDDEDEAFRHFAEMTRGRLVHLADLLCGDASRAEDLVQHALVKVYLAWPRLRDGNPESYARTVIVHANIDWWRRWRGREYVVAQPPEPAGTTDQAAEVARRDLVLRALATLTPKERAVVALRYYVDLSEDAIAREVGCAVGTVKSTASRALAKLREDTSLQREVNR